VENLTYKTIQHAIPTGWNFNPSFTLQHSEQYPMNIQGVTATSKL